MTPQKEKLVSNWCQNRKNHNFKRNKILQTIDFKGFAKKSQKISTHLLDSANKWCYNIVRTKEEGIKREPDVPRVSLTTSFQRNKVNKHEVLPEAAR